MNRIHIMIIFTLFLFLLCHCQGNNSPSRVADGADDSDPNNDDNDSNDDSDDDLDTGDQTEFDGSAKLHGIACGDDVMVLKRGGWKLLDGHFFSSCFSLNSTTKFLFRSYEWPNHDVFRLDNESFSPMGLQADLKGSIDLKFFNVNHGFAGWYEFSDDAWTMFDYAIFDFLSETDAVAVAEENQALVRWNNGEVTNITHASLNPLNNGMTEEGGFCFTKVKYLALDDIWVIMGRYGEAPYFLSHWNGYQWDQTELLGDENSPPKEWYFKFSFVDSNHGWLLVRSFGGGERASVLRSYQSGHWKTVNLAALLNREEICCYDVSAADYDEAWLTCFDSTVLPNNPEKDVKPFFVQITGMKAESWSMFGNRANMQISVGYDQ